jgi:hypothetical protein
MDCKKKTKMKNRKNHLEWNGALNPPVDFDVTMVRVALKDEEAERRNQVNVNDDLFCLEPRRRLSIFRRLKLQL